MKSKRFTHLFTWALVVILIFIIIVGIFPSFFAPNDPYENNLMEKFSSFNSKYPLGTDQLGRCILSRLIYGIKPTLGISFLVMVGTMTIGTFLGIISGYFLGIIDDLIMGIVNIVLSFPSQIMIFAVIALLGINIKNVILANILIKWAWYARMIRTGVIRYRNKNYVTFSKTVGMGNFYIFRKHIIPSIASELAVYITMDFGWSIINISTLSFLGLGVQPPTPEWGTMLNEAKSVIATNPVQMFAPGIAIIFVVTTFNLMGDMFRDYLDPKENILWEK